MKEEVSETADFVYEQWLQLRFELPRQMPFYYFLLRIPTCYATIYLKFLYWLVRKRAVSVDPRLFLVPERRSSQLVYAFPDMEN